MTQRTDETVDEGAEPWPESAPLESAWGLIANAWGGNWDEAPPEWKEAAERWRDRVWHPSLGDPDPMRDKDRGA